jgi:4-carboxymuconolactone decarboxylase
MSTLPKLGPQDLSPEQEEFWRSVVDSPRRKYMPDGPPQKISGPYSVWLQFPSFGRAGAEMGEILRMNVLPGDLREIAVFATAAWWKADYVFWGHAYAYGPEEGVDEAVIKALQTGEDPPFRTELQRLVHSAAVHLLTDGDMPRPLRDRLVEALGWPAIVHLVGIVGFYCVVGFTVNAFDVAMPEGAAPIWRGG